MLEEKEQEIQESTTEKEALEATEEPKISNQEAELPKETVVVTSEEETNEVAQEN